MIVEKMNQEEADQDVADEVRQSDPIIPLTARFW